jgi:hypothetical protein
MFATKQMISNLSATTVSEPCYDKSLAPNCVGSELFVSHLVREKRFAWLHLKSRIWVTSIG